MRRAARTDGNHSEVIKAFRDMGCSVWDTSRMGAGGPDCVVGINGVSVLVEIKDGSLSPSRRCLTKDEKEFQAGWRGGYAIAEDLGDVVRIVVELRRIALQGVM